MAGSVTIVSNKKVSPKYREIVMKWTSDASGDVNGEGTFAFPGGTLIGFWNVPGSGVTADFDVTLPANIPLDDGSNISIADLLQGAGVDLSESTDGDFVSIDASASSPTPVPQGSYVTLTVANAGATVSGAIILFFWEE
jgi:hypothetical protein